MSNKIKVLHVYKTAMPTTTGGVEVFIDDLCKSLSRYNVDSAVMYLAKKPSKEPVQMDGYKAHQVKQNLFVASTGFSIAAFSKLKKLAKEYDIIHYHFPNPFADILHFICNIKKPSIVTYHSDIIKQKSLLKLYKPLMYKFLSATDKIVATSPNYAKTSKVLKDFKEKLEIVPIGIDIANYPKPGQERIQYWSKKFQKPFFLFVGALRYYKGLFSALEAARDTDIQIAIGGAGGIEKELKDYANKHNLDNVHFLGFLSEEDKIALMQLCYGFIFPSHVRTEAFGIALLEAAAHGKPLISCEIGTGTTYINIDKKTGIVVPPESPANIKDAMQYLLNNPDVAERYGSNAKKRAEELFTANSQAESYLRLYKELIE